MDASDLFDGRIWCAFPRTTGEEMDEMFAWADDNGMDVLCQGITQGTPSNEEDQEWYSIWTFGHDDERLMFMLRFGSVDS
jgi:hypothetical protein